MTVIVERLETLVIARAAMAMGGLALGDLVKPLARFSPAEVTAGAWRDRLAETAGELRARGVLDGEHRLADADELGRRIGRSSARTWAQLADRVLPALGLVVAADDSKSLGRLVGRDAWAAAIAGRSLGLWLEGPPPSLTQLCDALAWRELELAGKPKRCPPEVRAVFVQRLLRSEAGPPERLVRLLAAREVGAPRPELRVLRDALVRGWLAGRTLGPARSPADADRAARRGDDGDGAVAEVAGDERGGASGDARGIAGDDGADAAGDERGAAGDAGAGDDGPGDARSGAGGDAAEGSGGGGTGDATEASGEGDDAVMGPGGEGSDGAGGEPGGRGPTSTFVDDVREAARAVRDGWFGDRKVFVSAVWDELRTRHRWAQLALDDFKALLFAAHCAGELTLARADLVAAMDPERVAASEIAVRGATFHFLVQEQEPAR